MRLMTLQVLIANTACILNIFAFYQSVKKRLAKPNVCIARVIQSSELSDMTYEHVDICQTIQWNALRICEHFDVVTSKTSLDFAHHGTFH